MLKFLTKALCLILIQAPFWSSSKALSVNPSAPYSFEVYGEYYQVPLSEITSDFLRIRSFYEKTQFAGSFLEGRIFGGVQNDHQSGSLNNFRTELGYRGNIYELGSWMASLERNFVNSSSLAYWQSKFGGFAGGDLFTYKKWAADYYFESFYVFPEGRKSYFSVSAHTDLFYRVYAQHNLMIDAVNFELRGSENSNKNEFGPDYMMLIVGPRVSYSRQDPLANASLFFGRSFQQSYSKKSSEASPYWFLMTIGVLF